MTEKNTRIDVNRSFFVFQTNNNQRQFLLYNKRKTIY